VAKIRAEQLETGEPLVKAGQILINRGAAEIFEFLITPSKHEQFDGSKTVQRQISGPKQLFLGAKFAMSMKIKIPYRISNKVVAFEPARAIAWRHFGRHIWRYELTAVSDTATWVKESFDGRPSLSQFWLARINAYENNQKAILKSLVRLKEVMEK
jgi:hypothetical protein